MASVQDLGERGTGRSPAETPLPLNGHRTPPEEELRRLVAGRPALERRVDTLLRLFEQPSADPGSFEEIEAALRRVGLRTEPPLDGRERDDVVSLVPGARPAPLR